MAGYSFEELEAQTAPPQQDPAQPAPVDFAALEEQAGVMPPVDATPVADDLSLFDRFQQTIDYRSGQLVDSLALATGLEKEQQEILLGRPMTAEEANKVMPTAAQSAWNIASEPVAMVWDWGSDMLIEAGQEGIGLLPETAQQAGKDALRGLMESPVGQAGMQAWQAGTDAWDGFSAKYPMEARTLAKGFNLIPGAKALRVAKESFPLELTPMRLERTGHRKILSAPEGRDADLYNMVTPDFDKKAKIEQIREGRVTDPGGPSGKQRVVPSQEEWRVVDALKPLPLNSSKTMTTNTNVVVREIDRLTEATRRAASGKRGGVPESVVMDDINTALQRATQENPGIFGVDGDKASKTIQDVLAHFEKSLDSNGGSWEGLLRSRQELDNFLINQIKIGTFGTGRKATAVTEAHKVIRDTVNSYVKNNVPGTADMLEKQHLLFRALDGMAPKAAGEAETALGRLLQSINMHNPTTPLAQVSTLLSPLVWAGAVVVSPFVLGKKAMGTARGAPMIANSVGATKYALRDVLREGRKAMQIMTDKRMKEQMQRDLKIIATLMHTLPGGEDEFNAAEE